MRFTTVAAINAGVVAGTAGKNTGRAAAAPGVTGRVHDGGLRAHSMRRVAASCDR